MTTLPASVPSGPLAAAAERVRDYVSQAKARNTLRAYAADWRHFTEWCRASGAAPLPPLPPL